MIYKHKYKSVVLHKDRKYATFKEYQLKDKDECVNLLLDFLDNKVPCTKFYTDKRLSPVVHNMVCYDCESQIIYF